MLRSTARIVRRSLVPIRLSPVFLKPFVGTPITTVRRPSAITSLWSIPPMPRVAVGNLFSRQFSSERNVLALIDAVQRKDTRAIDQIAKHTPHMIVEQTSNDNTALHEAARIGDVAMIETLAKAFSANFNLNHKCHCYKQRTPLAYAVEGGHIDAVKKLITLGANPDITDERGWTALDYAIDGVKSGANKIAYEKIGLTLLQYGGTAKKFPEEARVMQRELLASVAPKLFFEEYKVSARQKIAIAQKQYLDERKKLTSGKP